MSYKRLTVIIDAGHGGIIDQNYVTPGKRSPMWKDGSILYEGVFNRDVAEYLTEYFKRDGIEYIYLDSNHDIPLEQRTKIYNSLYELYPNCLLISIHSNAAQQESAHGFEIFTSPGQTKSDKFADVWAAQFNVNYPSFNLREDKTDGDHDKEANFWVLTQAKMPAVLIEHGFMTNEAECRNVLMNESFRMGFAKTIYDCVKKSESLLFPPLQ